ncbi:hypothetical protein FJT64_019897 [Amphibalanus amphitrite]|uniref:Uncharacterized protein n=1 Tax=Amphibalanus amphitrite TaxID=1232801 RepID=A0A6A4WUG6_AMPAM|nr:hypothetical protein FJT64_019897 [Amphibalanus amphitrite]
MECPFSAVKCPFSADECPFSADECLVPDSESPFSAVGHVSGELLVFDLAPRAVVPTFRLAPLMGAVRQSTLRPQVKDSPAQTDIVGGPAVPPPAGTGRPPTDRPPPLVAKVFGKRAREEDPAVSAVDACCERMFWVLENFIQGRLQKTTDEQSARGCRCLEGETRSAMTEAKHWVGRLSMRFGLSLRDQLKTCHKAIQHTLLAWQAVFQRAQLVHCDRGVQCALAPLEGSSPVPAAPPAAQPARGHASAAAAPRQADLRTPWDQTTGYRTLKTLFEGEN